MIKFLRDYTISDIVVWSFIACCILLMLAVLVNSGIQMKKIQDLTRVEDPIVRLNARIDSRAKRFERVRVPTRVEVDGPVVPQEKLEKV